MSISPVRPIEPGSGTRIRLMLMIFEPPAVPPFATTGVLCSDAGRTRHGTVRRMDNCGIALKFPITRRPIGAPVLSLAARLERDGLDVWPGHDEIAAHVSHRQSDHHPLSGL